MRTRPNSDSHCVRLDPLILDDIATDSCDVNSHDVAPQFLLSRSGRDGGTAAEARFRGGGREQAMANYGKSSARTSISRLSRKREKERERENFSVA